MMSSGWGIDQVPELPELPGAWHECFVGTNCDKVVTIVDVIGDCVDARLLAMSIDSRSSSEDEYRSC